MTLSQIQYFLTAARCLNFTVAAKELYMSQPALGRQISAMEDELGVKLFLRSKNSLNLTPVGSMLRDEFTSLMVHYNDILQKVYAMGQDNSIHIRIGVLEGYGLGDLLPEFLRHCQSEFPNLMVELYAYSYAELNRRLLTGELDLLLTFQYDVQDRPDVLCRPLWEVPLYFAYHRGAVDKERMAQTPGDQLLILNSPEDSAAAFALEEAACERMGVVLRYKLARTVNEQLFFVRQGYGCALLAGNSNLRTDPAILFEPREALEPVTLVGAWNIHTVNPSIHLCMELIQTLLRGSEEAKGW